MGLLLLAFALSFFALWLSLPTLYHGAVYIRMKQQKVEELLKIANARPGMRMADFGSGDGRVVIAFAKAGAEAHGYEIDPVLVLLSRLKIRRAGLSKQATIHWQSFWNAPARQFELITLFGFSTFMRRLEKKLQKELPPTAQIISLVYEFPSWTPQRRIGRFSIYRNV